MDLISTKKYIESKNLSLSKSLGQNLLINEDKLSNIIKYSELSDEDLVIEIGPGVGTLSIELAKKCGKLILIEIDTQFIPILDELFNTGEKSDKVVIIRDDALKIDYKEICDFHLKHDAKLKNIKVIANLPYYITTPIITKLILSIPAAERMIFMIQKEAADRLVSVTRKKEYGILSVLSQYYSQPQIVDILAPDCFFPQPTVESCLIVMKRQSVFPTDHEFLAFFMKVVQASFNQRRKTLMNSLGGSGIVQDGKRFLEQILISEGISVRTRAEELTYAQFAEITKKIIDKKL
ncbi:MAG: 16S rRNA (adenine(1518)-N(6)/adenine(1519)-N(6))-dimethyltransferase RsmA [Saccharofermentanales bacterium]